MIQKIKDNIWKFSFSLFGSNVYLVRLQNKKIIIDTSSKPNKKELIHDLRELRIEPEQIEVVILTHDHFDHTGDINLFENAKIYGDKYDFASKKINDIGELKIKELEIIKTPGHTEGGICIYFPKEKVLFSGDTLFEHGAVGRTDLEGGSYDKLRDSLKKIKTIDYKILCPGHDI